MIARCERIELVEGGQFACLPLDDSRRTPYLLHPAARAYLLQNQISAAFSGRFLGNPFVITGQSNVRDIAHALSAIRNTDGTYVDWSAERLPHLEDANWRSFDGNSIAYEMLRAIGARDLQRFQDGKRKQLSAFGQWWQATQPRPHGTALPASKRFGNDIQFGDVVRLERPVNKELLFTVADVTIDAIGGIVLSDCFGLQEFVRPNDRVCVLQEHELTPIVEQGEFGIVRVPRRELRPNDRVVLVYPDITALRDYVAGPRIPLLPSQRVRVTGTVAPYCVPVSPYATYRNTAALDLVNARIDIFDTRDHSVQTLRNGIAITLLAPEMIAVTEQSLRQEDQLSLKSLSQVQFGDRLLQEFSREPNKYVLANTATWGRHRRLTVWSERGISELTLNDDASYVVVDACRQPRTLIQTLTKLYEAQFGTPVPAQPSLALN